MEKKAKIFVCHHPAGLLLFENLSKIIRQCDPDAKIIFIKVNHPYFSNFNFESYKKYFDQIIEFDFVHYNENFIKEYFRIIKFIKKLKNAEKHVFNNFEKVDLFLQDSAWLPVNIILYNLSKSKKINNIFRIVELDIVTKNTKPSIFKSFLYNLYTIFFPCYPIKFIMSPEGKFANFQYKKRAPGKEIRVVSPINFDKTGEGNVLPFPIIQKGSSDEKKDMVLIMGDANIFKEFPEYFSSYEEFQQKTKNFLAAIEEKYKGYKICYKSHPADKAEFMLGIDPKKHIIFDNGTNAQTIFNDYYEKIKAVYTVFSTSAISSSYFGIPSYVFYQYFMNDAGKKRMDSIFLAENIASPFLFNAESIMDVGRIDDAKKSGLLNFEETKNLYKRILNI